MPLSSYITSENVKFTGVMTNAVVLDTTSDVRTLIESDTLSESDKAALFEFMVNTDSTPTSASGSATFAPAAVSGTATGLDNTAATAGKMALSFASAVTGASASGLLAGNGVAGYQTVNFTPTLVGSDATGLANDSTAYTATVAVNGVAKAISVVGSAAQTITTLLAEINTDLAGSATAAINGGDIRITSATTGEFSTVSIAVGTLFPAVTGYADLVAAVRGTGFAPVYSAIITVDGVDKRVSVTGAATTLANVVTKLNTDLASSATAAIASNQLVITSATTGSTSSVKLQDTGLLFGSLAGNAGVVFTQGTSPRTYTAVVYVDGVAKPVSLAGNAAQTFSPIVSAVTTAVGAAGTVTFTGGVLKVVSATTGTSSSVTIDPGTLLKNTAGFASVSSVKGVTSRLVAFYTPVQENSTVRPADRFLVKKVGLAPAIGPVPGKANLPKTMDYIYYGGSSLALRYLQDDSEV